MTSSTKFPAGAWLGHGLDLTQLTPLDIKTVTQKVIRAYRLIGLSDKTSDQTQGKITWRGVPDNVDLQDDIGAGESSYQYFKDGYAAANAFRSGIAASATYMAVSADATMNYSIDKTFSADNQYAMFSYNQTMILASLEDWGDSIDPKKDLAQKLASIESFDPTKIDTVSKYRNLFSVFGSHVITNAEYGARLSLHVWCGNSNSSINTQFDANMSVEFSGLTTKGKVDASVASSAEYKAFSQQAGRLVSCQGGDMKKAGMISSNSGKDAEIYQTYQDWIQTAETNPDVMSVQLMPLWQMMSASKDNSLVNRVPDVTKAYNWITANPQIHQTKCKFTINSDWGEFGLLSPAAKVKPDPSSPVSDPDVASNIVWGTTKVRWGTEHSHNFQRDVTIDFIVENDGSAIDFEMSHGTDGDHDQTGRCQVEFNNGSPATVVQNNGPKGNNWNTEWYYNIIPSTVVVGS